MKEETHRTKATRRFWPCYWCSGRAVPGICLVRRFVRVFVREPARPFSSTGGPAPAAMAGSTLGLSSGNTQEAQSKGSNTVQSGITAGYSSRRYIRAACQHADAASSQRAHTGI